MIDSYYRSPVQKVLIDPVLPFILKRDIHPNHITALALISGISIIPFLFFGMNFLALISLLLSGYFDILDGSVARLRKASTPHGAVFDIVSDRVVEFSIVFGLYLVAPETRGILCLLMLGSMLVCVTSFLVVGIFAENEGEKSFHYSPGIMERAEAFIFFVLMITLPSMFDLFAIVFILLVTITALIRVREFANQ
jgi:phosphatidylglycerophosphate synthase